MRGCCLRCLRCLDSYASSIVSIRVCVFFTRGVQSRASYLRCHKLRVGQEALGRELNALPGVGITDRSLRRSEVSGGTWCSTYPAGLGLAIARHARALRGLRSLSSPSSIARWASRKTRTCPDQSVAWVCQASACWPKTPWDSMAPKSPRQDKEYRDAYSGREPY